MNTCNLDGLPNFYTEYGSLALKLSLLDISRKCVQCFLYYMQNTQNFDLFVQNLLTYQRINFWLCRYVDSINLLKSLLRQLPITMVHYRIEIYIQVANSYRAWCCYDEAEKSVIEAENLLISFQNEILRSNLLLIKARLYMDTDRQKQGLDYALDCLQLRQQIYNKDHPEVAIALELVAKIHFSQNLLNEAQQFHEQAYELKMKVFGLYNFETIDSINEKGRLHLSHKRENEAMENFKLIGEISLTLLGPINQYQALSHNNLGCALFNIANYEASIAQHAAALHIYEHLCGSTHQKLIFSLNQMANANKQLGHARAALLIWKRCQRILEQSKTCNQKQLAIIKQNLQNLIINDED